MYSLDLGAFIWGLLILIAGVFFVRFHRVIADHLGNGISSYEKYQLWAVALCGIGLLTMLNLPGFLLNLLFSQLFS